MNWIEIDHAEYHEHLGQRVLGYEQSKYGIVWHHYADFHRKILKVERVFGEADGSLKEVYYINEDELR